MLWHVPSAGCAPVGVAGMDLGAEAVDPVEALFRHVPERALAELRSHMTDAFDPQHDWLP